MYGDAFVDIGGSECPVADIRTAGYLPSEEKNAGTGTEASGFAAEDDRGGRRLSLCDRKRYL